MEKSKRISNYMPTWLHDNCESFTPLAPFISDKFRYIALDSPGHGLTSILHWVPYLIIGNLSSTYRG